MTFLSVRISSLALTATTPGPIPPPALRDTKTASEPLTELWGAIALGRGRPLDPIVDGPWAGEDEGEEVAAAAASAAAAAEGGGPAPGGAVAVKAALSLIDALGGGGAGGGGAARSALARAAIWFVGEYVNKATGEEAWEVRAKRRSTRGVT